MLKASSVLRDRFLGAALALLASVGASAAELDTLKSLSVKTTGAARWSLPVIARRPSPSSA